jgi:hypothetical protein
VGFEVAAMLAVLSEASRDHNGAAHAGSNALFQNARNSVSGSHNNCQIHGLTNCRKVAIAPNSKHVGPIRIHGRWLPRTVDRAGCAKSCGQRSRACPLRLLRRCSSGKKLHSTTIEIAAWP